MKGGTALILNISVGTHLIAVILAGGRGKRLNPLTKETPKPLLLVRKKPILEHIILKLISSGLKHIIICTGYLSEEIEKFVLTLSNKEVLIEVLKEEKPLGTVGPLYSIAEKYKDQDFFVMNADILTDCKFDKFIDFHKSHNSPFSIVGVRKKQKIEFGVLEIKNGTLMDIVEKPNYEVYINGGIYIINSKIINKHVPPRIFIDMTDLIQKLTNKSFNIQVFISNEQWLDIGTPESYKLAKKNDNGG